MPAINKKGIKQTSDLGAVAWFESVSKGALADMVIDLIRRNAGDEHLDGADLLTAIIDDAEPVMVARGDKLPPADMWEREMVKYERRTRSSFVCGGSVTAEQQAASRVAAGERADTIKRNTLSWRPRFVWPE